MPPPVYQQETSSFDRALGFFDAIYGFAATLLVVNIDVTSREAWSSIDAFFSYGIGSQLLGFTISFIVIVGFWRRNHILLAELTGIDAVIIRINIIAAGCIIFIPFTTQGMSDPHTSDLPLPTAVYAINIALVVISQSVLLQVAARRGLLRTRLNRRQLRARAFESFTVPAVFIVSIPLAYLTDGDIAKLLWLTMLVLGPLGARVLRRLDARVDQQSPLAAT
jgi:uncharacterized membrane protein